jgi:hypothetical protein
VSDRSSVSVSQLPGVCSSISFFRDASRSDDRAEARTWHPAEAKRSAVARPIPSDAPVMNTVCCSRRTVGRLLEIRFFFKYTTTQLAIHPRNE